MAFFFKNFEVVQALLKPANNTERRFIVRRRSGSELFGAAVVFLLTAFVLSQVSVSGYPVLAVLLLLAASLATMLYVRDVDVLERDGNDDVVVVTGWPGFKSRLTIVKAKIEFIGVGIGEKAPASGKPHLVYIHHERGVTALQHFRIGREAVVMAKQVRQFVGM